MRPPSHQDVVCSDLDHVAATNDSAFNCDLQMSHSDVIKSLALVGVESHPKLNRMPVVVSRKLGVRVSPPCELSLQSEESVSDRSTFHASQPRIRRVIKECVHSDIPEAERLFIQSDPHLKAFFKSNLEVDELNLREWWLLDSGASLRSDFRIFLRDGFL